MLGNEDQNSLFSGSGKVGLERGTDGSRSIELDACTVDLDRRRVHRGTELIHLTPKENELLAYMVERPGQVVSRDDLLRDVWGYADGVRSRAPDTAIRTLRKKIEVDPANPVHVLSDYGVGYRFVPGSGTAPRPSEPGTERAPRTNLVEDTGLVLGRDQDLRALGERFGAGARLVSLIGGPGLGKTTTARRLACQLLEQQQGIAQAWFCDLSSARSADDIAESVSRALGLRLDASTDPESGVERVAQVLASRPPLLLILDNFEQLVDFALQTVGFWLSRAPELRLLVTTRERLRLHDEHVVELGPLDTQTSRELFDARTGLRGTPRGRTEQSTVELVELLDGIPLAIELAASRARILGVEGVRKRLDRGLGVLTTSMRDTPPRHRTLASAIDASWELLSATEQTVFAQLSVFRGGFSPEDAERVVVLPDAEGPPVWEVLESLMDKSMVHICEPTWPRFALYQSLRSYGRAQLEASGMRREVVIRHAEVLLELARPVVQTLHRFGFQSARESYELLCENLAAALERVLELEEAELAIRLVLCLVPHRRLGGASIGARLLRLESVLPFADRVDSTLRARFLVRLGEVMLSAHRIDEGRTQLQAAIACAQDPGAADVRARGLCVLAALEEDGSSFERARERIDQALEMSIEDPVLASEIHRRAGCIAGRTGRYGDAHSHMQSALQLARQARHLYLQIWSLDNLTVLYNAMGRLEEAEQMLDLAWGLTQELGDPAEIVMNQCSRAVLLHAGGRLPEARRALDATIDLCSEAGRVASEAAARQDRMMIQVELGELDGVREDLAWLESLGTSTLGWEALFVCGLSHQVLGSLEMAIERHDQALGVLESEGSASARAALLAMSAAARADRGEESAARERIEEAASFAPVDSLASGFVQIGRALCGLHASEPTESAGVILEQVRQRLADAPLTEEAMRLGVAAWLLERQIDGC